MASRKLSAKEKKQLVKAGERAGREAARPDPATIPIRAVHFGTSGFVETPLPGATAVRLVMGNGAVVEIVPKTHDAFEIRRIEGRRIAVWPEAANVVTVTVQGPLG